MELELLRNEIDEIDRELVALFEKRMNLSSQIGKFKRENAMDVLDENREKEILSRIADLSSDELAPYTKELYIKIFQLSRTCQSKDAKRRKEVE